MEGMNALGYLTILKEVRALESVIKSTKQPESIIVIGNDFNLLSLQSELEHEFIVTTLSKQKHTLKKNTYRNVTIHSSNGYILHGVLPVQIIIPHVS